MTTNSSPRSGLKWVKVRRFLSLPFSPKACRVWFRVDRFEDVPIDRLLLEGTRGVLLDVDGTLGPHLASQFSDSVIRHVKKMDESGLKVALFTNAHEDRFSQFEGIPVVTDVPPKPAKEAFEMAMQEFLDLNEAETIVMIGDNIITDGGAVTAGMKFIQVKALPGRENWVHGLSRWLADQIARLHEKLD